MEIFTRNSCLGSKNKTLAFSIPFSTPLRFKPEAAGNEILDIATAHSLHFPNRSQKTFVA